MSSVTHGQEELIELYAPLFVDGIRHDEVLVYLENEIIEEQTITTSAERYYQVQPGDQLSLIARQLFGKQERWKDLYAQNREIIKDPDVIEPGMVLKYKIDFNIVNSSTGIYKIVKGDNLHNIARKLFGDDKKWLKLWDANKKLLKDENTLEVGTVIRFDVDERHLETQSDETEKIKRLFFHSEPLIQAFKKTVRAEFVEKLKPVEFEYQGEKFFDMSVLKKMGVDVVFEEDDVFLKITTPANVRIPGAHSLNRFSDRDKREALPPAPFSSYMNLFASQPYSDATGNFERNPLSLGVDGAINIKSLVIDWEADYDEDNSAPWRRRSTQLIKDFPSSLLRVAAGDVNYSSTRFQGVESIGGLSINSEFGLQPNRLFVPTANKKLFLRTDSEVKIFQNGRLVSTLNLPAGNHDIKDLTLSPGQNDLIFEITDAAGRVERVNLSVLSSRQLLKTGLHEFSYNAGIPATPSGSDINYDDSNLVYSAFHRYGLSNQMTGGLSIQGDKDRLISGLELLFVSPIGFWALDFAGANHDTFGSGYAARLGFTKERAKDPKARNVNFSSSIQKTSRNFLALGEDQPNNRANINLEATFAFRIFSNIGAQIGTSYDFLHAGVANESYGYSVSAGINKALTSTLNLSLNGSHIFDGTNEFSSARLFLTWNPDVGHSASYSTDTQNKLHTLSYQYKSPSKGSSWDTLARTTQGADVSSYELGTGYSGNRGRVRLLHDFSKQGEDDLQQSGRLSYSTSIAYAGGLISWGQPITDSFVIVGRPDGKYGDIININGDIETGYQATANWLGPGVVPSVSAYRPFDVSLESDLSGDTVEITPSQTTFLPTLKSGFAVHPTAKVNLLAEGYLLKPNGTPLDLRACVLVSKKDEKQKVELFTSEDGYFFFEGAEPGDYWLSVKGGIYPPIDITLPDEASDIIDLGEIKLKQ